MTRGARAGHYRRVQLHLIGGFLGSGKTTAIASACELLRERGLRAAVVTNDQGEMLVDTGALAATGVATAEVTGGCFCCRYDELVARITALAADGAEHLFAEAVGSCVDIARTVVNPLLQRREVALQAITFSVLADVRLLADLLAGRPLPWSNPALRYLFERQLAEAPLLVATKVDLVAAAAGDRAGVADALQAAFPGQRVLIQDSRTAAGVAAWVRHIASDGAAPALLPANAPLPADAPLPAGALLPTDALLGRSAARGGGGLRALRGRRGGARLERPRSGADRHRGARHGRGTRGDRTGGSRPAAAAMPPSATSSSWSATTTATPR